MKKIVTCACGIARDDCEYHKPQGTFVCPKCGKDTPHNHIIQYQSAKVYFADKLGYEFDPSKEVWEHDGD